jgi:mannosyltransferase OCH1-like enzyme
MESVPKIVHQIWLGKAIRPAVWMRSVKDFCADHGYKYMLWTDSNILHLGLDGIEGLKGLFDAQKFEGKADIIRLLALYKFGGVYVDADTVITRPAKFAAFLEKNTAAVFFGWEDLTAARSKKLGKVGGTYLKRLVANSVIGARARHAFIQTLLERIVDNAAAEKGAAAWKAVGPMFVTRVYNEKKDWFPDVQIYPMKFFYPVHWGGIRDADHHTKIDLPPESMLFQYGYTTNKFGAAFWEEKNGI